MKEKKFVRVCLSLDAASYEKLSRLSDDSGVPSSQIVRNIIMRVDDASSLYKYISFIRSGSGS